VIDRAEVVAVAGDGGAGAVSFRHEKFAPQGGPDGGDGGQGGSVLLEATDDVTTLASLRFRRTYRADSGGRGGAKAMHGKSGVDLVIRVPVGTVVQRRAESGEPETIADLDHPGARVVAAYGGLGGKGNARFTTSTNQAPRIAERGQRGQRAELVLDLKLIADAGIIGVPSVGKSSLISAVSAAQSKIAAYPFTTLEPVLGVVDVGWHTYVMVDLPGLIEGAHVGAGLGHEFLRHVERTRVLVHMLDASREDSLHEFDMINEELALFNADLASRPQIVALNKIDLEEAQAHLPALEAALRERGIEPIAISVATGENVQTLVRRVATLLDEMRGEDSGWTEGGYAAPAEGESVQALAASTERDGGAEGDGSLPVVRPRPQRRFEVRRIAPGKFEVEGRRLAALAEMLNLSEDEARAEFFRRLSRFGVVAVLRRAGVRNGDRVRFGPTEVTWDFD
jgi:GTP-binding protein